MIPFNTSSGSATSDGRGLVVAFCFSVDSSGTRATVGKEVVEALGEGVTRADNDDPGRLIPGRLFGRFGER